MRLIVAFLIVMIVGLMSIFLNVGLDRRHGGSWSLPQVSLSPIVTDLGTSGLFWAVAYDRVIAVGEESGGIRIEPRGAGFAVLTETTEVRVTPPAGHRLQPRVAMIQENVGAIILEDNAGVQSLALYADMRRPVEPQSFSDKSRVYAEVVKTVRSDGAGSVAGVARGFRPSTASSDAGGAFFCGETPVRLGQELWFGYRLSGRLAVVAVLQSPCAEGSKAVRDRLGKAVQAFAGNR